MVAANNAGASSNSKDCAMYGPSWYMSWAEAIRAAYPPNSTTAMSAFAPNKCTCQSHWSHTYAADDQWDERPCLGSIYLITVEDGRQNEGHKHDGRACNRGLVTVRDPAIGTASILRGHVESLGIYLTSDATAVGLWRVMYKDGGIEG